MVKKISRIGLMTSGGDAPGMNPCIRAIVRTAIAHDLEAFGIHQGYEGLIKGTIDPLRARDVGGIIQRGGTILETARSEAFRTKEGQREAIRQLNEEGIDGLIVIGGDGSLTGAHVLAEQGVRVVGIPGSIDNDIFGTNMSIGVDTAMNTILLAIDRLRDTAASHHRAFIVETMGRNCGYLAVMAGIIGGAEVTLIPEVDQTIEQVAKAMEDAYRRGKNHCLVIVAEGATPNAADLKSGLDQLDVGFRSRVTILGHIQRGGSPSAFDRLLATRMGVRAVEALLEGESDVMVGLEGRELVLVPLKEAIGKSRQPDPEYFEIASMLAK
jgi:6-phosphofructokinase 1